MAELITAKTLFPGNDRILVWTIVVISGHLCRWKVGEEGKYKFFFRNGLKGKWSG